MSNKIALAWLQRLAISAEELQQELLEHQEISESHKEQYNVIVESGGATANMVVDVTTPEEMSTELDKLVKVEVDADHDAAVPSETIDAMVGSAVVGALEDLQQSILDKGIGDHTVNRYEAIYNVFFHKDPNVPPETVETVEVAIESLRTRLMDHFNVSAESFGEYLVVKE